MTADQVGPDGRNISTTKAFQQEISEKVVLRSDHPTPVWPPTQAFILTIV